MTGFPDVRVIRYVDGDLTGNARAEFEAELDRSPALRARVDEHVRLGTSIRRAFGPAPDDQDLSVIVARLNLSETVRGPMWKLRHSIRALRLARRRAPAAMALAATLALGLFGGWMLHRPNQTSLFGNDIDGIVASSLLASTLTERLASETAAQPIQIHLTFASRSGICRTFSVDPQIDGLACRASDKWVIKALSARRNDNSSAQFRVAASGTTPEVMSAVDRLIEGTPFDSERERQSRAMRWQR